MTTDKRTEEQKRPQGIANAARDRMVAQSTESEIRITNAQGKVSASAARENMIRANQAKQR